MINDKMAKVDWTLNSFMKSPHILVAGTTGAGKSVLMNAMLYSVLMPESGWFTTTEKMPRLTLIDTKRVELVQYRDWQGCSTWDYDMTNILGDLAYVCKAMEDRYARMEALKLKETDEPHWYVVIDELADLVSDKRMLEYIVRIGRLGRAAHIHLFCGTQDPSRTTLSAQLMQNFTCRIALRCKDKIESRQIIGCEGAEKIDRYGFAYIDVDGKRGWFEFERVPDEDIVNLVQSVKAAIDWSKWMRSKPTLKERIFRTREKHKNFINQCYDPDFMERLRTGHAKI